MYFSELLTLKAGSKSIDSYGDTSLSFTEKVVNADKKSVTRSEFYTANMAGVKVDIVFTVHAEDYDDQQFVSFDSTNYEVVRAYQKGEGVVDLMCVEREVY